MCSKFLLFFLLFVEKFYIFASMIDINGFIRRAGIDGQEGLAEKLGITRKAVASWSSGDRSPTYDMCVRLLEAGMTVEELFGKPYRNSARTESIELDTAARDALRTLVKNLNI